MTKRRDFKALVRERMGRTGESYAAARRLTAAKRSSTDVESNPLPGRLKAVLAGMSGDDLFWWNAAWNVAASILKQLEAAGKPASAEEMLLVLGKSEDDYLHWLDTHGDGGEWDSKSLRVETGGTFPNVYRMLVAALKGIALGQDADRMQVEADLLGKVRGVLRVLHPNGDPFWDDSTLHLAKLVTGHLVASGGPVTADAALAIVGQSGRDPVAVHAWLSSGPVGVGWDGKEGKWRADGQIMEQTVYMLAFALREVAKGTEIPPVPAGCPYCGRPKAGLGGRFKEHLAACKRDHAPSAPTDSRFWRTHGLEWLGQRTDDARAAWAAAFSAKWGHDPELTVNRMTEEIAIYLKNLAELEMAPSS
jgi:hypothetical protein